jgi:CheY-like chemotaxis protein
MKTLRNILLVEDDQITNYINKRLIKKVDSSFGIHITQNGLEGLSFIKQSIDQSKNIPDLIFLDLNMPVLDGFEFLQDFQKLPLKEKVIVVILTTSEHIKDIDKLLESGNSDIIAKPLTEEKFITIVDKYFNNHSVIKS